MPQFICIRDCVLPMPGVHQGPKRIKAGQILTRKEIPNHHFVKMDPDIRGMDLYDILKEKLENLGVDVLETWDEKFMERILAEKEQEVQQQGTREYLIKALEQVGQRVHPSIGMKKLLARAKEHGISSKRGEEPAEDRYPAE